MKTDRNLGIRNVWAFGQDGLAESVTEDLADQTFRVVAA
jgi:hypothetical protein